MAEAQALMGGGDVAPESDAVVRLAERSGCTACDCEFIAVAEALSAPLFTFDKQLLAAFPEVARRPTEPT